MQYAEQIVLHVEIIAIGHFGVLLMKFSLDSIVIHEHMSVSVVSRLFVVEADCVSELVNYIPDLLFVENRKKNAPKLPKS